MPRPLPPRLALLLATLVCAVSGCSSLFFFPDAEHRVSPPDLGLAYEELFIDSEGERLHAWLLRAAPSSPEPSDPGAPGPAVLFLHGNAENISSHIGSVHWLPAEGFAVLLFDYRGYGRSTGKPSIAGAHADARAALRTLAARPEVDPARILILGQSLGGSIAAVVVTQMREEIPVRSLVLDSAFSGYRTIAREKLAAVWLTWPLQWPLSLLFPAKPDPLAAVAGMAGTPLLIVHGDSDEIVPIVHAERLHAVAPPGTPFWRVPGAGHIQAFSARPWRRRLVEYWQKLLASP